MTTEIKCPDCGCRDKTETVWTDVHYWNGEYIEFDIPLLICVSCKKECTDHRAELVREAIQKAFDPACKGHTYSITQD